MDEIPIVCSKHQTQWHHTLETTTKEPVTDEECRWNYYQICYVEFLQMMRASESQSNLQEQVYGQQQSGTAATDAREHQDANLRETERACIRFVNRHCICCTKHLVEGHGRTDYKCERSQG